MGIELSPALVALMRWGDEWLNDGNPPTVLVHDECGRELEQGFWCRTCRTTITPTDIGSIHPHDPEPSPHATAPAALEARDNNVTLDPQLEHTTNSQTGAA